MTSKDLMELFRAGSPAWAEENFVPIFPDLARKLLDDIYGFAYQRGHIDIKTRHLISLGVLAAIGDCENQLNFQFRAGFNLGLTGDEMREALIQVCVFAGNARAINAALLLKQIENSSD